MENAANDLEKIKELICEAVSDNADWAFDISREIFQHPEYSDKEFFSSNYIVEKMKDVGFKVDKPYIELETAFRCSYGTDGGANVGFLAEYDALPGYGPSHDQMAHACGHNWIAATSALAALAVSKIADVYKKPFKVFLFGTPGEEETGRKVDMAKAGAFDELDAVFQMHLARDNSVDTVALAMTDFLFEFHGKAAHASSFPEHGVNALDACQLTIAAINALRQQLPPEVKIHATYVDGGGKASVIPEYASLSIYVRDESKDRLELVIEKLLNIGRGAELMTGARFSYIRAANTYYDLKNDKILKGYMKKNLKRVGVTGFVKGDIYHAVSSDIGNVSYRCPTSYCNMGTKHLSDAEIHEETFLEVADSPGAHELIKKGAAAMAMSAVDVIYESKS